MTGDTYADLVTCEMVALRGVSLRDEPALYDETMSDVWREISGPLLEEYCNFYAAGYSVQKTAITLQNLIWEREPKS